MIPTDIISNICLKFKWTWERAMEKGLQIENSGERRSEERTVADEYFSVQFQPKGFPSIYQFKIRNISSKGLCILIKNDSQVLEHINVGDIFEMTYYGSDSGTNARVMQTRIKHITLGEPGNFEGHHLVGLAIEK